MGEKFNVLLFQILDDFVEICGCFAEQFDANTHQFEFVVDFDYIKCFVRLEFLVGDDDWCRFWFRFADFIIAVAGRNGIHDAAIFWPFGGINCFHVVFHAVIG